MKQSSAKKNILKKIKQALDKPVPLPFKDIDAAKDVFINDNTDLEFLFAENFSALQGRFAFCENAKELVQQLHTLFQTRKWDKVFVAESDLKKILGAEGLNINDNSSLAESDAAITSCESLVARTGSILLSSVQNGRTISVYAPVHICIAYMHQLVFDINDAIQLVKQKYPSGIPSLITFASGPSRTADIEKTLVTGVHGPKEVFCFLLQS
jgi:L-lactate dehydrogenase complex protein LldG